MAMGRFGQIVGPLVAGALLSNGWTADRIMIVIAGAGLIGAVFAVLFWFATRDTSRAALDGGAPAKIPRPA
jgi:hypothetical protein